MATIVIEDLPAIETLTDEELAEIFGAGRTQPFRRLGFDRLERREMMSGTPNTTPPVAPVFSTTVLVGSVVAGAPTVANDTAATAKQAAAAPKAAALLPSHTTLHVTTNGSTVTLKADVDDTALNLFGPPKGDVHFLLLDGFSYADQSVVPLSNGTAIGTFNILPGHGYTAIATFNSGDYEQTEDRANFASSPAMAIGDKDAPYSSQPQFLFSGQLGIQQYELSIKGPTSITQSIHPTEMRLPSPLNYTFQAWTLDTPLAKGDYVAQVRGIESTGRVTDWSAPKSFSVKSPLPPSFIVGPQTDVDTNVTFRWSASLVAGSSLVSPFQRQSPTGYEYRLNDMTTNTNGNIQEVDMDIFPLAGLNPSLFGASPLELGHTYELSVRTLINVKGMKNGVSEVMETAKGDTWTTIRFNTRIDAPVVSFTAATGTNPIPAISITHENRMYDATKAYEITVTDAVTNTVFEEKVMGTSNLNWQLVKDPATGISSRTTTWQPSKDLQSGHTYRFEVRAIGETSKQSNIPTVVSQPSNAFQYQMKSSDSGAVTQPITPDTTQPTSADGYTYPSTSWKSYSIIHQKATVSGQTVTITASVTGYNNAIAHGRLTFYDAFQGPIDLAIPVAQRMLDNGVTTTTFSLVLAPGKHVIRTKFNPSLNSGFFQGESGGVMATDNTDLVLDIANPNPPPVPVQQTSTTMNLKLTPNSTTTTLYGHYVGVIATINPATTVGANQLTGNVIFSIKGEQIVEPLDPLSRTAQLSANLSYKLLDVGSYTVTARFVSTNPNVGNCDSSKQAPVPITITPLHTEITSPTSNHSAYWVDEEVTLKAQVFVTTKDNSPYGLSVHQGTVTFFDGLVPFNTVDVDLAGNATCPLSHVSEGFHNYTAKYNGSKNFLDSEISDSNQIRFTKHTPDVGATGGTSSDGSSMAYDIRLNSMSDGALFDFNSPTTPNGKVSFSLDGRSLGTQTLANGTATISAQGLTGKEQFLTVSYSGDANYSAVTKNIPVLQLKSTFTTLTSTASSIIVGQAAQLTANVGYVGGKGLPVGTVVFSEGQKTLGTASLVGGKATFSATDLAIGQHTITATYYGSGNVAPSSASFVQTIVATTGTSTSLTASANRVGIGQPLTFTAAISPISTSSANPSGTVTFTIDGVAQPSVALVGGKAMLNTSSLAVGQHTVVAAYSGDTMFAKSVSGGVIITVSSATTTRVTLSKSTIAPGERLSITTNVASNVGGIPTGSVSLYVDGNFVNTFGTMGGQAIFNAPPLTAGQHTITVNYSGDTQYAPSSNSTSVAVQKLAIAPTFASTTPNWVTGQPINFVATFFNPSVGTAVMPIGKATLSVDDQVVSTVTLDAGRANLTTTIATNGFHTVKVSYTGDDRFESASASVTQYVQGTASITTFTPSATTVAKGQEVVLVAHVRSATGSGIPTGKVTFNEGFGQLGQVDLINGDATFRTSDLGVGSHSITATYQGGADFEGSNTTQQTILVQSVVSTTTVVTSSTATSTYGSSVTLSAKVASPAGTIPTGSVDFFDGTTKLGSATLDNKGVATLSTPGLNIGSHVISATFAGNGVWGASRSNGQSLTIQTAPTTTTLAVSATSVQAGQQITLKASVGGGKGTLTGSVSFFDGNTLLGKANLSADGTATYMGTLPVGTHSIFATYFGSDTLSPSGTPIQAITVSPVVLKAATTTSMSASATSLQFGQAVTLNASVNSGAGSATGTVTFKDGSTILGTANLVNGKATYNVPSLTVGAHSITASYSGGGSFAASNSVGQAVNVQSAFTTVTSLTSSASTVQLGQYTTLTAMITSPNGLPVGTVTFKDGSTILGVASVIAGKASLTTSLTPVGTHAITATYSGAGAFASSSSTGLAVNVQALVNVSTTTTLAASTKSVAAGQLVTFTANVKGTSGTPTGLVTFKDGNTIVATVNLVDGKASCNIAIAAGTHSLTASYAGGSGYVASASAPLSIATNQITTSTSLTTSATSLKTGQLATFTAIVGSTSGAPTGTVIFRDGNTILATVNASVGKAVFSTAFAAGTHTITAEFSGVDAFANSSSTGQVLTVTGAQKMAAVVSLSAPSGSSINGKPITFTATVAAAAGGGTPNGTVQFFGNGNTLLGTATIVNGKASISTTALGIMNNSITAVYSGDTTFAAGTSAVLTHMRYLA